eukprot:719968-Pyramimonas_sp.AAC.1
MQAGLPPPYWTCAVRYFCLCYNARTPEKGSLVGNVDLGIRLRRRFFPSGHSCVMRPRQNRDFG